MQRQITATTQRERKLFVNADVEEKTVKLSISMNKNENIGEIIKVYRYRQNYRLTQEELADFIGVKHFTLRSWEQNKAKPPYKIWKKYKEILK